MNLSKAAVAIINETKSINIDAEDMLLHLRAAEVVDFEAWTAAFKQYRHQQSEFARSRMSLLPRLHGQSVDMLSPKRSDDDIVRGRSAMDAYLSSLEMRQSKIMSQIVDIQTEFQKLKGAIDSKGGVHEPSTSKDELVMDATQSGQPKEKERRGSVLMRKLTRGSSIKGVPSPYSAVTVE